MTDSGPIETRVELEAWEAAQRLRGGDPADYERLLVDLAPRLEEPLSPAAVLRLARLGWESFVGLPDVPSSAPPVFAGRPWDEMPAPGGLSTDSSVARSATPGSAPEAYAADLAQHLLSWVVSHGVEGTRAVQQAARTYPTLLARADFRAVVGWERSLDVHAAGMLVAERLSRPVGGAELSAGEEAAFFGWVHLATYADVPAEHLREQAERREIRLAHVRQPAGEVARLVCEVPFADRLGLQRTLDAAWDAQRGGITQSWKEVAEGLRRLAATAGPDRDRWAARLRGIDSGGPTDLTEGADRGDPLYSAYVHGRLMLWCAENDVPVQTTRMRRADFYCRRIVSRLVRAEHRQASQPFLNAHLVAAYAMYRKYGDYAIAEDLLLLAWLMDQGRFRIALGPYLAKRTAVLDRAARSGLPADG